MASNYPPGVTGHEPQIAGSELGVCGWFALCDRPATGTLDHPVLGEVPICDRCRTRIGAL